ncbi:MAG: MurR/RpiR family transcriptional regulator [Bulleidia sp.]
MRIIDQIRMRETFTPTEHTIAEYLEKNSRDVVNMSLEELSTTLYVSKSSIIRFCKKLGFRGHKELCVKLAKEMDTFVFENEMINPSNPFRESDTTARIAGKTYQLSHGAMYDTYNDLDLNEISQLADMIEHAGRLNVYAIDECALAAEYLKATMESIGILCVTAQYSGHLIENALHQPKNTAALILTYSKFTQELRRTAEILQESHIPIWLVSGVEKNVLSPYADHRILMRYYEPSPKICPIGSKSAILLVLDIIYGEVFRRNYDKNVAYIRECEKKRSNHNQ